MSDTSVSPPQPPRSRGLRWLLMASLAVNLVFVGGLAALWMKGPPGPRHFGTSQSAFGLMMFSRELPPERRDAVRRHLRDARAELKALRGDLQSARKKAVGELTSSTYTPERMRAALDAVAAAENRMRDAGAAALMKAIGELTPDDRQKLAEAWNRRIDRGPKRKVGADEKDASPDELPSPN